MYKRVLSRLVRMAGSHFKKVNMMQQSSRKVEERQAKERDAAENAARQSGSGASSSDFGPVRMTTPTAGGPGTGLSRLGQVKQVA